MNWTIGIVLAVLLLMTIVLFFMLKSEVKDINNKSKVYFMRKAQEYTDSIVKKKTEKDVSVEEEKKEENKIEEDKVRSTVVYVEKKANYEINDLLKIMKQIDDNFQINNVNIIKSFIRSYVSNDEEKLYRYHSLNEMKSYINKVGIFNIITNFDDELNDKVIKDLRLINEDIFMEYYSGKDIFDVEDFCNFLDYEIGKCDPTIYVYVGNNKFNYNEIDKRIKTIYSDDIYKGVKIVYLNKMYDFSLS